jgi:hypothetical protein
MAMKVIFETLLYSYRYQGQLKILINNKNRFIRNFHYYYWLGKTLIKLVNHPKPILYVHLSLADK